MSKTFNLQEIDMLHTGLWTLEQDHQLRALIAKRDEANAAARQNQANRLRDYFLRIDAPRLNAMADGIIECVESGDNVADLIGYLVTNADDVVARLLPFCKQEHTK